MISVDQQLAGIPDYFGIDMMLKATPSQEGDDRYVYLEAASESVDQQNEVVLAKALEESADHYMKFGNLDIDHKSMPTVAKAMGINDPEMWEIGTPVAVRLSGKSTFVKARLFAGDTPLAAKANMVWESMTKLNPPKRWYPSVGGKVLSRDVKIDPKTGDKVGVVSQVRWTNVALSGHPVNQHIGAVQTIPFGVLAKSWSPDGYDLVKALEASYAADATQKVGGAAFGVQSLDTGGAPHSYYDFREKLALAVNRGKVKSQSMAGLIEYSVASLGLSHDEASDWVDRFLGDLKSGLSNKRSK